MIAIMELNTFDELEAYLQDFVNFHGDPAPYDFVGAFTLFSAICDNMSRNSGEGDLDQLQDHAPFLSDAQVMLLRSLLARNEGAAR